MTKRWSPNTALQRHASQSVFREPMPPKLPPWRIRVLLAALVAVLPGLLLGGFMMYVAWEHNPQGEFHEQALIHWDAWLGIGLSWSVAVTAICALITGPLFFLTGCHRP